MRTAEEIIKEYPINWESNSDKFWDFYIVKSMINQARKEAIEECAEIALTPDNTTKFQIESLINKLQ